MQEKRSVNFARQRSATCISPSYFLGKVNSVKITKKKEGKEMKSQRRSELLF
jgi:Zn-finger protein